MFILVTTILKFLLVVVVFVMPLATLLIWMERRQSAFSQDRLGPWRAHFMRVAGRRVSLGGLLHPIADAIKMFFKEYFVPGDADPTDRVLHAIAPLIGFVTALLVMAVIPFAPDMPTDAALAPVVWLGGVFGLDLQAWALDIVSQHPVIPMQIARLDAGLLVVFAVSSLGVYGLALAGWSSRNRFALLGGIRASAQAISYEIALGLTVVGVLLAFGTTELQALVHAQNVNSSIGVPYWGVLLQPFGAVLFLTAAMAETKRTPFDIPEAESEIIGYFTEYSSMGFGLFMLGEFVEVVTLSAVFTTLFLGGWSIPWWMGETTLYLPGLSELLSLAGITLSTSGLGGAGFHWVSFAIGAAVFALKVLLLCAIQLQIRWTLPRFRYDQLMHLGWKSLLPLALLNVTVATILVAVDPELDVMLYTGILMLVAFAGVVIAGPREKPAAAEAH